MTTLRGLKRASRAAATRGLGTIPAALKRVAAVYQGKAPEWDYEQYWSPATEQEARDLVIEPYSSEEVFETLGRADGERIKAMVPDQESVLLEFGCGVGRIITYLTGYRKIYGLDVSSRMLAFARERVPDANVEFRKVDGLKLPMEDASVDFLFSILVLQHIDRKDVPHLLTEFHRIVRKGGLLYLQFPEEGDGEEDRHTRPYTEEQVRLMLRDFSIARLDRSTHRNHLGLDIGDDTGARWTQILVVARRD